MKSHYSFLSAALFAGIVASAVSGASGASYPQPSPSETPRASKTVALNAPREHKEGGSNVGGTNRPSPIGPVTEWCRGSIGVLRSARQMVGVSLLGSDYATAIATYRSGIIQAIQRAEDSELNHSLTLRTLERTLVIGDALQAAMAGANDRDLRVVDFYNMSYDFVIKVAEEIDIPLYIPYMRSGRPFDIKSHEAQFAKYGVEQLKWVLENFTFESSEMYYGQFNDVVYLNLAEIVTVGVAEDLSQSLFANAYACQVEDLSQLSQLLARHNAGDRTVYGGRNKYALNSSAGAIKEVIKKLNAGCANSKF